MRFASTFFDCLNRYFCCFSDANAAERRPFNHLRVDPASALADPLGAAMQQTSSSLSPNSNSLLPGAGAMPLLPRVGDEALRNLERQMGSP